MTETFTWPVTADDVSGDETASTVSARFGDGYVQETKDGLNNTRQKWTASTEPLRKNEALEVVEFFRARGGAEAFFWTTPLGEELYFKCKTWKPQELGGGWWVINMSFEQDYKP